MNNLVKRTLSGAVFIAVVISSIMLHPYAYAGVFLVVLVWALLEFYDIITLERVLVNQYIGVLIGIVLFGASFLYAQGDVFTIFNAQIEISGKVFLILIPLVVFLFINQLYSEYKNPFRSIAYTLLGVMYIALPLSLCNMMVFPYHTQQYVSDILLGFFILLWANDTFAYVTGMLFGKNRLFERISPKKSWEGFWGGLICTVALSLLVAQLFPVLSFVNWIVVAVLIVVFGVYGDLIESLLKRNLHIKDSGHFLPGHGGILDRFDSVLVAAPMVFFYLSLFVFD